MIPQRAFLFGLAVGVAMLLLVLATGQTFGQRCERAGYAWGTAEHSDCIARLQAGRGMKG